MTFLIFTRLETKNLQGAVLSARRSIGTSWYRPMLHRDVFQAPFEGLP